MNCFTVRSIGIHSAVTKSDISWLQTRETEIEDAVYMEYENDHQRKDVDIETNSSNHNKDMETSISEFLFIKW